MSKIDIKGIDKADLLAALVNGASPLGVGVLIALTEPGGMTREGAAKLCEKHLRFDYVRGRPIKTDISGDTMDVRLYDRDAGEGEAARIVEELRKGGGK